MLSHLDKDNNPNMVDVSGKNSSERYAHAQTIVTLPANIVEHIQDGDIKTKKGSVFQIAIIAGIMGAKKTSELIPLCHPIGLDDCKVEVDLNDQNQVVIHCRTKVSHKTGVEMEALTGASVAALTVYDMLKAMSHDIVIGPTQLMEKTGGKADFKRT